MGIVAIFVLFMIGILFFIYWIPKKLGYPKVGKYLSIILSVFLVLIVSFWIFKDAFFTKNQARELLTTQNITLQDDFKVLNNQTTSPISEYYHRFRLEISEDDKNRIISEIKNAEGFIGLGEEKIQLFSNPKNYSASKVIQNYEDDGMFVKEYFRPNHEGKAYVYKKIELEKNVNTLVFLEMQD